MARLPRVTSVPFGSTGTTDDFETFGSAAAGPPTYSKSISAIQGGPAWLSGWRAALIASKAPVLQDMNGKMLVDSYMISYLLQEGIPEYDSGTTYNWGSVVKLPYSGANNFQIFVSLADSNTGNALPTAPASNGNWQFVFGFISSVFTMGTSLAFGSTSTEGILGTLTNDAGAAGIVGQYIESIVSAVNFPSTTVYGDATSISLTAGDWDVSLNTLLQSQGATGLIYSIGISTTTGNSTTGLVIGSNYLINTVGPSDNVALTISNYRISLATTTTIYAKYEAGYSGGPPKFYGRLSARRMR